MKKYLTGVLLTCVIGLHNDNIVHAQDTSPTLKNDRPSSYTVVAGDTLWDISSKFLQDAWRWQEVWQGNSQIENPNLIYPGDVIQLIFVDGQAQIIVNNEQLSTENSINDEPQEAKKILPPTVSKTKTLPTVKLSPQIRSSIITNAIPSIPLSKINNFLLRNRVVEPSALDQAPHIIAGQESRVILSAGDTMYARGAFDNNTRSYGIYRKGQSYIDPSTKQLLGVQAVDIGTANITNANEDKGKFAITRSTSEIRIGDRLLPIEQREIKANFLPEPPQNMVEGTIMNVERGVSQAGKLDIIAINLGANVDIKQGHLLGIFKRGENIRDRNAQSSTSRKVTLPDERAGLVMVFQVFEKMSLAIVLEAERGVKLEDIVRTP